MKQMKGTTSKILGYNMEVIDADNQVALHSFEISEIGQAYNWALRMKEKYPGCTINTQEIIETKTIHYRSISEEEFKHFADNPSSIRNTRD